MVWSISTASKLMLRLKHLNARWRAMAGRLTLFVPHAFRKLHMICYDFQRFGRAKSGRAATRRRLAAAQAPRHGAPRSGASSAAGAAARSAAERRQRRRRRRGAERRKAAPSAPQAPRRGAPRSGTAGATVLNIQKRHSERFMGVHEWCFDFQVTFDRQRAFLVPNRTLDMNFSN